MPRELKCECNKPSCPTCYKRNWIRQKREKIKNQKSLEKIEGKQRLDDQKLTDYIKTKVEEDRTPFHASIKEKRIRQGESKLLFGLPSEGSRVYLMDERSGETVEVKEGDGQQEGLRVW